jgi:hypothetical protein
MYQRGARISDTHHLAHMVGWPVGRHGKSLPVLKGRMIHHMITKQAKGLESIYLYVFRPADRNGTPLH